MKRKIYLILFSFLIVSFKTVNDRPVHVFMIGDSTMSNKSQKALPETGWGQVLSSFFNEDVVVKNYARNGRSSKSFIDEGLWDSVIKYMDKGDYLIIQFGHNDNKVDEKRHTDPFTTYTANLEKFINESRARGAIPILCTSIVRRHFNDDGSLMDTHGDFLKAVKKVAKDKSTYFIDMEEETKKVVENLGPDKSKSLYMFIPPEIYPTKWEGVSDSTHLTQIGAYTFASLAIQQMKLKNIPLAAYLKDL